MMNPATMYMSITSILSIHRMLYVASASLAPPRGGGNGVLWFQVTGMIEGFFLGLKFSILGFFWVRKIDKYFFGWLDLNENVMICGERKLGKKF